MKIFILIITLLLIKQNSLSQSCQALNNKVSQLIQKGDFNEALIFAEKASKKCENKDVNLLNLLAVLYNKTNNYTKAIPLYLESIQTARLEKNWSIYLNSLIDIAHVYINLDDYPKAEFYLVQAYKFIRKNAEASELLQYAILMTDLANVYFEEADYGKAEPLYLKALEINDNALNNYHPSLALSLTNLGKLYFTIGNYSKAEPLYLRAYKIRVKILSRKDVDFCSTLDDLGDLYFNMGDSAKAAKYYFEAFDIRRTSLGEQSMQLAASLSRLGKMYTASGDYERAKPLILQALEIKRNIIGENNRDYAKTLESLALLYFSMGNYEKAEILFTQLIAIKRALYGELHLEYANSLFNLANLYSRTNKQGQADSILKLSIDIFQKNWRSNLRFLSSEESNKFIRVNKSKIEFALSFLYRNHDANSLTSVLTLNLFLKNILLSNNNLLRQKANLNKDSTIAIKWETYKSLRFQIGKQYQLPFDQQRNLKNMVDQIEVLERDLMHKLPEFQQAFLNKNITWKDVQRQLKPNEAAIDFVSFHYFDRQWTDTILYAAFVLRPGWAKPKFVSLFFEDQLATLIGDETNSLNVNHLYDRPNPLDRSSDINIYRLLWQPIDSLIKGVDKVYLSPSGILHRIAFSAIPIPEGGKLIDRYEISILSNIRILAEQHTGDTTISSFTFFGNIDYDKLPSVQVISSNYVSKSAKIATTFDSLRNLRGGKWVYLPGSLKEIVNIQNIAKGLKIPVIYYSKEAASEENFKQLNIGTVRRPSIIHIATHGFTFSTIDKNPNDDILFVKENRSVFQQSDDPMTRAGIVLAGGNEIWTTGKPFPDREDGILTAREVSDLDLQGCVLATLSACETGLGEIKGSEGVFGLQRAFKMAGVQYIIASLWKVPDNETAEFMEIFYNNWLKQKMPIRKAFNQTQIMMSKKYKPSKWAAFELIE